MKYHRLVRGGLVLGVVVLAMIAISISWANVGTSAALTPTVQPANAVVSVAINSPVVAGAELAPEPFPAQRPQATPVPPGNPTSVPSGALLLVPLMAVVCSLAILRAHHGLADERAQESARASQGRLTACQECGG